MGGSSGEQAKYVRQGPNAGAANMYAAAAQQTDPRVRQLLSAYGSGGMDYRTALQQAGSTGLDTSGTSSEARALEQQIAAKRAGIEAKYAQLIPGVNPEADQQKQAELDNTVGPDLDRLDQLQANIKAAQGTSIADMLATSTETGGKLATDQVLGNELYRGLWNKGGMADQAQQAYGRAQDETELVRGLMGESREDLKGRGESYGLTPQDLAAYGQASDQLARMYGAQEQGLAQSLANRGLGAAPSGTGAQAFSNLYGNQMEQLKGAQMQIAQQRINTARGLAQDRMQADLQRAGLANQAAQGAGSLSLGLGNLGMAAHGQQYNQNLAGIASRRGDSASAAQLGMQNQAQQQEMLNEAFAQRQATKTPSFLEQIGSGIAGGIAGAPGALIGGFTGKAGSKLADKWIK